MLAAACGDDDDTEASDETTEDTAAEEEGASIATEVGEAAPECEGTEDGTLTIGALLPETGDLAFLGPPEIAGAQLAVSEINAAGGVNGAPLSYLPGDSGDESPDVANQTVDRHLSAGADAILGAAASGITRNVIDKVTGDCVIQFSPANTAKDLTTYADDGLYFRTAPSDILQGRVLADMAIADGISTAAILARGDAYGEGLLEDIKGPFEEQGGDVVVEKVYDPEAGNFEAEVDEVVSADPDALFMVGFEESAGILNALFEQGFTADQKQIYLVDGNVGNSLGENFTEQGVLVGVKGTLPAVELQDDFKAKLDSTYPGLTDYSYGPETYDAVIDHRPRGAGRRHRQPERGGRQDQRRHPRRREVHELRRLQGAARRWCRRHRLRRSLGPAVVQQGGRAHRGQLRHPDVRSRQPDRHRGDRVPDGEALAPPPSAIQPHPAMRSGAGSCGGRPRRVVADPRTSARLAGHPGSRGDSGRPPTPFASGTSERPLSPRGRRRTTARATRPGPACRGRARSPSGR